MFGMEFMYFCLLRMGFSWAAFSFAFLAEFCADWN